MAESPFRMLWRERGSAECGVQIMHLDPHTDTAPHDHLFLELALIEKGDALHHTASGTVQIRAGELLVIRPGVWHGYSQCRSMVVTNCLINTGLLHTIMPTLAAAPGADSLFRRRTRRPAEDVPLTLTPPRWAFVQIRELLGTMYSEQDACQEAWQGVNTGILLQVLSLILRTSRLPYGPGEVSADAASAVRQVAAAIERSYTQSIPLAQLASSVKLSPPHLSRSFKRLLGMGLVDYRHQLRIEEACRLLRLTDSSISTIATRVGYDELAYFSRCFRRRMGKSPLEYRRAI